MALIALIIKQFRTSKKQQDTINKKNLSLQSLLGEKNALLYQKDGLLAEKEYLLEEKERLLREIHHRVKNNLQVVMSLLNSQVALLKDQAALSAIQESGHRVQAMALIHQKLYQAQGVARIPMHDYIQEVAAYLHDCYSLYGAVRVYTQAVPLGLIINEAVTNALEYAFPSERPGQVRVALQRLEEGICRLIVVDDEVGLPSGYDPCQSRSLGMTLLHGFSAQLGGNLTITSSPGLTITLVFREEQLSSTYTRTSHVY
jgi:two-component sensor histidine kinase